MASKLTYDDGSGSLPGVSGKFNPGTSDFSHQNKKKKKKKRKSKNKGQSLVKDGENHDDNGNEVMNYDHNAENLDILQDSENLPISHDKEDIDNKRDITDDKRDVNDLNKDNSPMKYHQGKDLVEVLRETRNFCENDVFQKDNNKSGRIGEQPSNHVNNYQASNNIDNHQVNNHVNQQVSNHNNNHQVASNQVINHPISNHQVGIEYSNDIYLANQLNRSNINESNRLGNGYTLPPNIPILQNVWSSKNINLGEKSNPLRKSLPILFDDYRIDINNNLLTKGLERHYGSSINTYIPKHDENQLNIPSNIPNDSKLPSLHYSHNNYNVDNPHYRPNIHLKSTNNPDLNPSYQKNVLDSPLHYENYHFDALHRNSRDSNGKTLSKVESHEFFKVNSNQSSPNDYETRTCSNVKTPINNNTDNSSNNKNNNINNNNHKNKNNNNGDIGSSKKSSMLHRFDPKELDNITTPKLPNSKQYTVSPRKQAFMRYKKSDDMLDHNLHEVKNNLKNNLKNTPQTNFKENIITNGKDELDLDEKVTLFKYKSANISVYDDNVLDNKISKSSSGRLLSHGEFEIFQLHNGDVTYLSCGQTFIYPLLPKVRVLRVNFNLFILPLQYPERYWKICINSDEAHVMDVCENTFKRSVQYSDLFNNDSKDNNNDVSDKSNLLPNFSISTEIPPSPPSAPISPHNIILGEFTNKKLSEDFLLSDFSKYSAHAIQQPKPKRIVHRRMKSNKSDSSMDSLLDEYEENITYSKAQSRMHSRRQSNASRAPIEDFPSTSLSEYNRSHNNKSFNQHALKNNFVNIKNSIRSRRSSRSDLYAAETGWMEPSILPKTKSTYSLASCPNPELNNTFKNVYRSITQRNLRQYNDDELSVKSQRVPTNTKIQTNYTRNLKINRQVPPTNLPNVKLDSTEIFRLISANKPNTKQPPPTKKGFTSRLFGW